MSRDPETRQLLPFPVVGVGASAGGLSALLGLLDHLPPDCQFAFIVVLHLPPKDAESVLPILERATSMPVVKLTEPVDLLPNHLYLVPSRHCVMLEGGRLQTAPVEHPAAETSIDRFFRTLADACQSRAIGLVLSGTGNDGAAGLAHIREQGGVTIAQAPEDADHAAMPRAAIASGFVDFILPVTEIPDRLSVLWDNARNINLPPLTVVETTARGADEAGAPGVSARGAARPRLVAPPAGSSGVAGPGAADHRVAPDGGSDPADSAPVAAGEEPQHSSDGDARTAQTTAAEEQALREIIETLRVRTRHDIRHYKRATVLRRIARRMQVTGVPDLPAYRDLLRDQADETAPLLQDMLISVTSFFRDPTAMSALERNVLPKLLQGRRPDEPIRVWVVGCATGEEAYSISILLHELMADAPLPTPIQIFATDIDDRAISVARNGLYPGGIAADVTASRLRTFFTVEDDNFRVAKSVRESVLFASHNILQDAPFSRLDLILCRNLLIYLDREAQASILDVFRHALKPGGHLFLGTAETTEAAHGAFTPVDASNRLYIVNPRLPEEPGSGRMPVLNAGSNPRSSPLRPPLRMRNQPLPPQAPESPQDLHRRLLIEAAPASVLIDASRAILHTTPGAARFMVHAPGAPSNALMAHTHPDLRLELHAALLAAADSGKPVQVRRIPVQWHQGDGQETGGVDLRVHPYRDTRSGATYSVILFEAVPFLEQEPGRGADAAAGSDLQELLNENRRLKEQLRQTIDRFDNSNDELRASNAELAAINEAMRNTSEELETKKEELQSMNEELIAVNHEMKAKVDESGQMHDDFQNLSAAASAIALFLDRGLNVKRFTPAAATLFGLTAGNPTRTLEEIAAQLDHTSLDAEAAEALRTLQPVEKLVQGSDGRFFLARIQPYRTIRDSIEGAVLNLTDVTELQRTREHLREAQEVLRIAADASKHYAVLMLDRDGRINGWNAGSQRVFGYAATEIVGQPFEVLADAEERSRGIPQDALRNARERGSAERERTYRRKDGSTFRGSSALTALYGDPARGFVEAVHDLSEVLQAHAIRDELLAREHALSQKVNAARRAQDELFDVLASELKRPLSLIQVNAEMLLRLPETRNIAVAGKVAESISKAVANQSHIVDSLRDLSLARSGKLTLQMQVVGLRDLVEGVVNTMKDQAAAKSLSLDFSSVSEPLTALCDPARIQQITRNLVANAIKFTEHGGVTVQLSRDGDSARLAVTDTGIGMGPDLLESILEPGAQPAIPAARPKRGMGIGLALVKELVSAHEGTIRADSEGAERGSTFTVWLRLVEPVRDAREEALLAGAGPVDQEVPDNPLKGLRIVLVDDSVDLLTSFGALMTLEGAQVDCFESAEEALARLLRGDVDLLISDLGMPGMNGYELIAEVRKQPQLASLPAIALTGYGRTRDPGHAVRSGFNAHTTKPATVEELKNIVALLKSL
jgi:two-component system CheB/CheR fusion protein